MVSFHSILVSAIALSAPISAAVIAPVAKPAAAPVYSVRGIGGLGDLLGDNDGLIGGLFPSFGPSTAAAAAPQPATIPAPSFTSAVTSLQVVQTFYFYTARSNELNRLVQSFTSTDILNFSRGLGLIPQFVTTFTQMVTALPAAVATLSRAPVFTSLTDVNNIFNAYQEFVNTQNLILKNLTDRVSFLKGFPVFSNIFRQSFSFVATFSGYMNIIIPSRATDVQRISLSFSFSFQAAFYSYTGVRAKREISQPLRIMPREITAAA